MFGVVWVGEKAHPERGRGGSRGRSGQGQLRADSVVPRLLARLLKNSSDLGENWYILGSNYDAFCHSFN